MRLEREKWIVDFTFSTTNLNPWVSWYKFSHKENIFIIIIIIFKTNNFTKNIKKKRITKRWTYSLKFFLRFAGENVAVFGSVSWVGFQRVLRVRAKAKFDFLFYLARLPSFSKCQLPAILFPYFTRAKKCYFRTLKKKKKKKFASTKSIIF